MGEFCDNVATEKWIMQGGKLRIEGAPVEEKEEKETGNKTQEDIYDAAGNKIDVKLNQKLSDKDAKKAIKDIEKKLKDAKKKKTLTDEEMGVGGQARGTEGEPQSVSLGSPKEADSHSL